MILFLSGVPFLAWFVVVFLDLLFIVSEVFWGVSPPPMFGCMLTGAVSAVVCIRLEEGEGGVPAQSVLVSSWSKEGEGGVPAQGVLVSS